MIELRWLYSQRNDVDRVLQYRYQKHIFNINPFKTNDGDNIAEIWTDWQTVTEMSAATDERSGPVG